MWIETIWPSSTVTFSRTVRRPQIVRECEEGGICSPAGREGHAERLHAGHTRGIECPGDACCCAPRSLLRLPGSPVLRRRDLDPLIEEVWSC